MIFIGGPFDGKEQVVAGNPYIDYEIPEYVYPRTVKHIGPNDSLISPVGMRYHRYKGDGRTYKYVGVSPARFHISNPFTGECKSVPTPGDYTEPTNRTDQ
jgi:hypothetical protein